MQSFVGKLVTGSNACEMEVINCVHTNACAAPGNSFASFIPEVVTGPTKKIMISITGICLN